MMKIEEGIKGIQPNQMKGYMRLGASCPKDCTWMASEGSEMNYTNTLPSSKLPTSFTTSAGADDYMHSARLTKCIPTLLQATAIPVPLWGKLWL